MISCPTQIATTGPGMMAVPRPKHMRFGKEQRHAGDTCWCRFRRFMAMPSLASPACPVGQAIASTSPAVAPAADTACLSSPSLTPSSHEDVSERSVPQLPPSRIPGTVAVKSTSQTSSPAFSTVGSQDRGMQPSGSVRNLIHKFQR